MKKNVRMAVILGLCLMMGSAMIGCGKQAEDITVPADTETVEPETDEAEETEQTKQEETEADNTEDTGSEAGLANPWKDCTEEEAKAACTRLFKAPDGANVKGWSIMDTEDETIGFLVQLSFDMDDVDYTARAQYGVSEDEDIAGMYYDWATTEETTLANWGEGNMQAKVSRYSEDGKMIDLCTWYDVEIGISYSLSAAAADLEGFDIRAIAEQMYDEANEPETEEDEVVGTEEDGQNPVMNIIGDYDANIFRMLILAEGKNGADISVMGDNDDGSHYMLEMHGIFDEETNTITYSDCQKHLYTVDKETGEESECIDYTEGTGSIKVNDDYTLEWTDDQEHLGDGVVLSF